jgi:hypothetical protein
MVVVVITRRADQLLDRFAEDGPNKANDQHGSDES